ncbi:tyrosine-type recombinase/integrase [Gemmata sp. JC673]|uniref:Tyrosine-type recombinase/integrase n=1 Tax=Gemmata algarum TaxID=2975278 RepID=A0ABU5EUT3_9BACT|nr:tyrosine-type recombinase/integrase [Gemmata algarum]MDY3557593.1 tyrosine-type recombinase/integrase [Gemmata algarum]
MARQNAPWYRAVRDCWYVRFEGKLTSLGVKGKGNQEAAKTAFEKLRTTPKPPPITAGPVLLPQAFAQFLVACKLSRKPNTVARYEYDAGDFVNDHPTLEPAQVTADHIRQWLSDLDVGQTTKAIMLRSVSAFFGWLVKEDKLEKNPVKKVTRPKTASRSDKALISEADHKRLLEGASRDFRDVLVVLHGTGCRPGELQQITAETFNYKDRVVVITEHKTDHTGKPRPVYLTPELAELLHSKLVKYPTGPLLRGNKGVPWTGRAITESMKKLRKKTGVKVIAYGYRHTFVTDGLKSGLSNSQVAALVGHTTTAVIDRFYSHLGAAGDALRAALKFREKPKPDDQAA